MVSMWRRRESLWVRMWRSRESLWVRMWWRRVSLGEDMEARVSLGEDVEERLLSESFCWETKSVKLCHNCVSRQNLIMLCILRRSVSVCFTVCV